jgi:hypothetical protein
MNTLQDDLDILCSFVTAINKLVVTRETAWRTTEARPVKPLEQDLELLIKC